MMKKFFITGTDTGVGKTVVSAVLTAGLNAHYWKPIQSGLDDDMSDPELVQELTGIPSTNFLDSVYALKASLSPDQAASLEDISIDLDKCQLPQVSNHLIVEGAGGVFVPLNEQHTMLDLMEKLQLPVIIVTRGGLGTINHTLMTIATLRQRNITIYGVIFNGTLNPENQSAIEKFGNVKTLMHIPWFDGAIVPMKQEIAEFITKKADIFHSFITPSLDDSKSVSTHLAQRDQKNIWHPFTQHQMTDLPIPITRGKGAYLYDQNNKAYLDLVSSWWVNLYGHAHPEIAKAIYDQALTLEHVIFSGFTHEPAVALAEKLLALLPATFSKIFYSDNGSTAVEVALKMAYQFWRNQGEVKRTRFIAFENGYHGDTFGAMSVGKKCGFFSQFDDLLFPVDMFAYPSTWLKDEDVLNKETDVLNQLKHHLEKYGNETAALIIEPLVQGSSGMQMCTPRFLQSLEKLVRQYGVLIIYDEVMTGFGRTGDLFACLKSNTTPDIICLAKGLSGGFLPLAVTACHERIYQAFMGDSFTRALAHGHSFTANPLGCAAGLMSLSILQRPETQQQIAMIERVHQYGLAELSTSTRVEKSRYCGTIVAFELPVNIGYGSSVSLALRSRFLEKGLLIRPLGNVIYFLPPYCMSESELKRAYDIVIHEIEGVTV